MDTSRLIDLEIERMNRKADVVLVLSCLLVFKHDLVIAAWCPTRSRGQVNPRVSLREIIMIISVNCYEVGFWNWIHC